MSPVRFSCVVVVLGILTAVTAAGPIAPNGVPGLAVWLEADTLALANGASVNTWADSSGNANDAVASTAGSYVAPTYQSSIAGLGGLPAVHFARTSSERLDASDVLGDTAVTAGTIITVYRVDANTEAGRPVGLGSNTGDGLMSNRHWNLAPDPSLRFDGSNMPSSNYTLGHPTNRFVLRTSTKNGQVFNEYFDGTPVLKNKTHGPTLNIVDELAIGDLHGSAASPGVTNADVAEVLLYDRVLSSAERRGVEQHLMRKYSLDTRGDWRFENGAPGQPDPGTTGNVLDSSLFGNHGTARSANSTTLPVYSSDTIGAVPVSGAPTVLAMHFERASQNIVEVGDENSLDFGNQDFTLEAYVKLDAVSQRNLAGRQYVAIKKLIGQADSKLDYSLMACIGDLGAQFGKTSGRTGQELALSLGDGSAYRTIASTLMIDDDEWHYIAAAFDAENDAVLFSLDGLNEWVMGVTFDPAPNNGQLVIGGHFNSSGALDAPFDGLIDELRITAGIVPANERLNAPEPASAALLALGLAALARRATRRRR